MRCQYMLNEHLAIRPRHEKPCLHGSRPGATNTGLYRHNKRDGSFNFENLKIQG